jgi:hypothetical protein
VLYALEVTNSVQGIFWRSFNSPAGSTSEQQNQEYAARMPSNVHYTITFTDEYGDEHVTSLLSVEYKSFCDNDNCYTHPDFTVQSLEEHAESVNQSLGALPRGAIENKYVWTVGTEYDATGVAQEPSGLTGQTYQIYPQDHFTVNAPDEPISVHVDQLEYRLDVEVIHPGCLGVDINGAVEATQYGLCMFVQIENPGVQSALKVQYFYNPTFPAADSTRLSADLETEVVSGQTRGFNTQGILDPNDIFSVDDPLYLVTVQDLQADRVWNVNDGDVSKLFISEAVTTLDMCSKRGLCDFDTGMCDCFSGYSGIRCDDQNAIAYSY